MGSCQKEKLESSLKFVLEEARIVVPGVQAILGFQLIAVFNSEFHKLGRIQQIGHLVSIGLTVIGMILVLSLAAYHRLSNHEVSAQLLQACSGFLVAGMFALMLAICVDFNLICNLILEQSEISGLLTVILFLAFLFQWFAIPKLLKL